MIREPFLAFIAELLRRLHDAGYDDLRIAHLVVFQHIDREGSRVTDLAAKAQMAKPSMSYLVEHLEEAGYLERLPDPTDGRAAALRPARMASLRRLLTALGTITAPWRAGEARA